MKKILLTSLLLLLFLGAARAATAEVKPLTVMVYMCGSNLESRNSAAALDIAEMQASGFDADRVNLRVMAGGAKRWSLEAIPEGQTVYIGFSEGRRGKKQLSYSAPMPEINMGEASALTAFVRDTMAECPAQRYALILWDHGSGPMLGVCEDETYELDRLTLKELAQALSDAELPEKLSFIGFDACLMGTVEVADAMAPFAEYMVASESTEPETGWDYAFLKGIEADGSGAETGARIVDMYMAARKDDQRLTLACTDLSGMAALESAMDAFFGPLSQQLDKSSFVRLSGQRLSTLSFGDGVRGIESDGLDLVDLRDLVRGYRAGGDAQPVLDALADAEVYARATEEGLGGLSVYHPYYNHAMFEKMWPVYETLSFCDGYTRYIRQFGSLLTLDESENWQGMITRDKGFDGNMDNWFNLLLSPEQQAAFSSAQLIVLRPSLVDSDGTGALFSQTGGIDQEVAAYAPIYIGDASLDGDGLLSGYYTGRALYVTDADGNAILRPLSYRLSPDGGTYYLCAEYSDASGREDAAPATRVLLSCTADAEGRLSVVNTQVYDPLGGIFSNRIGLSPERYTRLAFDSLAARMPAGEDPIPGFDTWQSKWEQLSRENYHYYTGEIDLDAEWQLRFFDYQQSGAQLYAAFQLTDIQQNTYMSELLPVTNPNLRAARVLPERIYVDGADVSCYVVEDVSPLEPSVSLCLEFTLRADYGYHEVEELRINGTRIPDYTAWTNHVSLADYNPVDHLFFNLGRESLTGFDAIESVDVRLKDVDEPLRFYPQDFDVSAIAPKATVPLASALHNGILKELLSLSRGGADRIDGVIRIANESERDYYCAESVLLDGLCMQAERDALTIPPGTDACIAFKLYDSAFLGAGSLTIGGMSWSRYLSLDRLLEREGDATVERVTLLHSGVDTPVERWDLDLAEPVDLGAAGGDIPDADYATLPLLRGDVSVEVERLLVADGGVGARLRLRNDTDEDACVSLSNFNIDGARVNNTVQTLAVGARGTAVACVDIDARGVLLPGTGISDIGMTFEVFNCVYPMAHIRLDRPVALGVGGGAYLSAGDFTTEPADFERRDLLAMTPAAIEAEWFTVRAYGRRIGDYDTENLMVGTAAKPRFGLLLEIENRSDVAVESLSTYLVLNDGYETGTRWSGSDIAPGDTVRRTWFIEPEALNAVGEVDRVRCVLEMRRADDQRDIIESIPIDVRVDAASRPGAVTPRTPLCECEADGVRWQLLSVEIDGKGRLTGWLNVVNETEEKRQFYGSAMTVHGLRGDDHIPEFTLFANDSQLIPFTFENDVRLFAPILTVPGTTGYALPQWERLLQRHGVTAVEALTFHMGTGSFSEGVTFTLALPEPLSVEGGGAAGDGRTLMMERGDVRVWLDSVLVGETGVSLALELQNDSDDTLAVSMEDGVIDGLYRWFDCRESNLTQLLPRSTTVLCIAASDMPVGGSVREIRLPFTVWRSFEASEDCGTATVTLNAGVETTHTAGLKLESDAWTVEPTSPDGGRMVDEIPLPRAEDVRPTTLYPPLDAERLARFDHGTAALCVAEGLESEYDDETYTYEYVTLDLSVDENGNVCAPYSGLVLCWSGEPEIVHEDTRDGVSRFRVNVFEFIDDYDEFEVRESEAPDGLLDLLPVGLPSFYEPGMEVYPGIRVSYEYWVRNADGALTLLDGRVERTDLETGAPVEEGEEYPDGVYVVRNLYYDGDYDEPGRTYCWHEDYGEKHPSLAPVETIVNEYSVGGIFVRYHIWYTDGEEEIIIDRY